MPGWVLVITTAVALLAALLRWAARPPDTAAIAQWAARYNLTLHPDDHHHLSQQLRRGRWLRTLGFVVPFVIGEGATVWWGVAYAQPLPPFPLRLLAAPSAWAVGYLLGAVAAELTRRPPHPRQLRAAALVPRRLADYLPAWMLWAERAVAVAVLALVPLGSSGEPWAHSRGITTAVAAIAVVALVEVTLRVMVRRRQPVATTGELAIDDALRSTSIHRAAGSGLAALLFLLPSQLGTLNLGGPWWAIASVAGLMCYGLAIGCWKDLTSPLWWPVRRGISPGPRPPAQPPRPQQDPGQESA
jgi:hypothetical protein